MEQTNENNGLVPSNFLKWGKWVADYVVLVDKSQQRVMLYRSDNLSAPEKTYQCSTGENDGRKSVVNDKKTPEGIYYFVNAYPEESLSPIYGALALPLNYPNIFDVKEGRNGYGIWFHGLNKPLKPRDTSGCIALVNKDIEDLANYITLNNTPVIISSNIKMSTQEELEKNAREISGIIDGWRDSWQKKDIETYMSYYSRSFKSGNKNWSQVKDYKAQLSKKYKEIKVEIDDLGILLNDNVVIASFKQTYWTPVFESSGTKRLYITKNSDEWKIIGETFSMADAKKAPVTPALPKKRLEASVSDEAQTAMLTPEPEVRQNEYTGTKIAAVTPQLSDESGESIPGKVQVALKTDMSPSVKEKAEDTSQVNAISGLEENIRENSPPSEQPFAKTLTPDDDPRDDIQDLINSWIDAWESKDTDRYISFYDEKFISRGMNLEAWKRHRARLNDKYVEINIEISELNISKVSDEQVEVTFTQSYRADGYADYGQKTMLLIKKGKEWKINKEEWRTISG